MTAWPSSILPQDRDNRFNRMADWVCSAYRVLADGEQVVSMSVTVIGTDGRASIVARCPDGTLRRFLVTEDAGEALGVLLAPGDSAEEVA